MNTKNIIAAIVLLAVVSTLVLINNGQTTPSLRVDGKVKVDLYS